ncbi:Nuclear fragile X mental retardation-interacting protein 1 conserved domain [Arabidopsis suecica]|uniref:Nuclear fragile X mental retardation-interacting protein 1 conserved domain n=1 Tax=Arabidopsis suecica TaxID=45249 RepID=A0A8T1ZAV7_ARASU|nr:Nuclear fragile X mental retardation-interacting protein 1 conserved domain [Arabidopsis suecica]
MRPPFNSFQPQARPYRPQQQQQQQQNNGYSNHHQQQNGYQNPMNSNQLGMMNPQMMSNPMMGHMNNPIPMPNMPIHPQFFNNMPQQQQLHQFAMPNHINQLLPNLLGNLQFAVANSNLMGHSLPNLFQPNLEHSAFTSRPQLNSFNSLPYPPVPNHQLGPPGFSEPRPQGQSVGIVDNTNGSGPNGNDFRNKFTKFKGPGQGFQRPQLHQADNGKRKSGFNKDHRGKGNYNKMKNGLDGSDAGNIAKEKKRSYALMYTPKDVHQWREARRKNFPTRLNVEKKVKKYVSASILDEEAKMRRQQLREVLAKQAELGVEVAEVPSHYLSNTDEQVHGDNGDNYGNFQYKNGQKGKFQNNRHKMRRHGKKDKFDKKPRLDDKKSSQESFMSTRKPTLLEKLLSANIKRDKIHLLQVFRFMVMNSLLEEFPERPLKLPLITVEETGCEHAMDDPSIDALCDDLSDDDDVDVDVGDNSCDEDVVA